MLEQIKKTREYLDYIEEHYLNVQKAWKEVQEKCKGFKIIYDDYPFWILDNEVKGHDVSKLSENEFIQYRKAFFPTTEEEKGGKYDMSEAWEHHKDKNMHHWQNWAKPEETDDWPINCMHMVIDWMAMGYKFGDTAENYYLKNKDKIKIPEYATGFLNSLFESIR